jgi:hypothetical protein
VTYKTINSKSCLTLLVDTSRSDSLGHNFVYTKSFRSVYLSSGRNFCFISPSANIAKKSDVFLSDLAEYKNVDQDNDLMDSSIDAIFDVISKSEKDFFHIFFLWGGQLNVDNISKLNSLCELSQKKIGVSILWKFPGLLSRYCTDETLRQERLLIGLLSNFPIPVRLFAWDDRENWEVKPPIESLTEYFEYSKIRSVQQPTNQNRSPKVSFFGNLTSERGLGELLFLACLNPLVTFNIVGFGKVDKAFWRPHGYRSKRQTPLKWIIGLLLSFVAVMTTKLPNVKYSPEHYFEDHKDLEFAVQDSQMVYYSTRNSGISSGIINMSLYYGVPIIWRAGNSPASDLLRTHFPQGSILRKHFLPGFFTAFVRSVLNMQNPTCPETGTNFVKDIIGMCRIHA